MPEAMLSDLQGFIREALGCGCPDEALAHIESRPRPEVFREFEEAQLLEVGGRLLVLVLQPIEWRPLADALAGVLERGRLLRDAMGCNRFRCVVATPAAEAAREPLARAAHAALRADERLHLHVIDIDSLPRRLRRPPAGALRSPATAPEWTAYYALRWQVLRAPWQQPLGSERDALEPGAYHLAWFDPAGGALAVGRMHRLDARRGQIRYMAVEPASRGQGLGRAVLMCLEREARRRGIAELVLNARDCALDFYRSAGYEITGEGPLLFGSIPHRSLRKVLP